MSAAITRRAALAAGLAPLTTRALAQAGTSQIPRWGMFEASFAGPQRGNPFTDVTFAARFQHEHRAIDADGHILEPLDLWDQRRTQKPRQTRSPAGVKLIAPASLPRM